MFVLPCCMFYILLLSLGLVSMHWCHHWWMYFWIHLNCLELGLWWFWHQELVLISEFWMGGPPNLICALIWLTDSMLCFSNKVAVLILSRILVPFNSLSNLFWDFWSSVMHFVCTSSFDHLIFPHKHNSLYLSESY